jgi:hypothetical protein
MMTTARHAALPDDVATLQAQLRLCRAANADLHRQLQRPPPVEAPAASPTALVRSLKAEIAWLRGRLATFKAEYRTLRDARAQEVRALTQARDTALQRIAQLEGNIRLLEAATALYRLSGAQDASDTPVRGRDLTRLLALAHPDKWSQGQPATALAHELAIAIQQLREQQEACA